MTSLTVVFLAVLVAIIVCHVCAAILRRPQVGILLLMALVPVDGLLVLLDLSVAFNLWKEVLTFFTLLATFLPWSARERNTAMLGRLPAWGGPLLVMGFATLIALPMSPVINTIAGLKVSFFYVLVAYALHRCPFTAKDRDRLVSIIMLMGTLTAAYGVAQQVLGPERLVEFGYRYNEHIRFSGGQLRSISSFVQPFQFAFYVMMALLIGLAVASQRPSRPRNFAFLLISPLLVLGIASAVVRGAILGLVVGVIVLLAIRAPRSLIAPVVAGVVVVLMLPPALRNTLLSSSSLVERSTGWTDQLATILAAPFGTGLGSVGSGAELASHLTGFIRDYYPPDNQFVQMLLQTGPLGMIGLVALFVLVGVMAWRLVLRTPDLQDKTLALGVLAQTSAMVVASSVANYLEIFPLDVVFWTLLGALWSIDVRPSGSTHSHSDQAAAECRPTSVSYSDPSPH